MGEGRRNLVLPVRLRGDADRLAEQGRLLVLARPESGAMATGWEKASDGKWYYFEGSGAMRSGGWMKQGGTCTT